MTPPDTTTILSGLTLIGVLWRVVEGFETKKDLKEIRKQDEEMRLERLVNLDNTLASMKKISEDTNAQVRKINGTVAALVQWKEDHERNLHSNKTGSRHTTRS